MAHARPAPLRVIKDVIAPAAVGLALAVAMPLLGIAALLLRGAAVAAVAVAVGVLAIVGLWKVVEPSLSPRWRSIIADYAAPVALAAALVVCMPLLGIIALVVRGTVVALLLAAVAIGGAVMLWRSHASRRPRLTA